MQLESAIGFGLSAALSGAITFKDGRIEQGNFHEYPVVRMHQMPDVDVRILNTGAQRPSGIGEPGVPVDRPGSGERARHDRRQTACARCRFRQSGVELT